jgi:TonB family protein
MAYLPLPSPSNLPKRATPPLQSLFPSEPIGPSEVKALFANLRQILDSGASLDSILGAITDAAGVMTRANGIALALLSHGTVVCRARAGEVAPRVGSQLNVDSGISGECFRTGTAFRCDDTQTDDRVDPEVCRFLGIRSIAVVPLCSPEGTVGILGAFSTRPHAFNGEHLSFLQRLAEIAEIANGGEFEAGFGTTGTRLAQIPETLARPEHIAAPIPGEALSADLSGERHFKSKRLYWTFGGLLVVLMLMSAVIWISASDPEVGAVSSQPAPELQIAQHENSDHTASTAPAWKPTPGTVQVRVDRLATKDARRSAPTLALEQRAGLGVFSSHLTVAGASAPPPSPTSEISSQPPPAVAAIAPDVADLAPFVSTTGSLPAADLPIFQGVTDAALEHKVLPVYPPEARTNRLGGTVVLEATIDQDGSTQDVKVISGSPLLAQAATEAVRQWRYHPSLLNGNPVAVQRLITVVFKAP